MRTEMVIRMQTSSDQKGHSKTKAMKIAAETRGVQSVTTLAAGKDGDLLLVVVGDGVDCNDLTTRLRKKVGRADVVELRTLRDGHRAAGLGYGNSYGHHPAASSYAPASEYYSHHRPSLYEYYGYNPPPPPPYAATVVHHDYYPAGDQNSCAVM